jgi:hypothetical protein
MPSSESISVSLRRRYWPGPSRLKPLPVPPPPLGGPRHVEEGVDLQATIDTLRAEVAQVRVALQQYRQSQSQS